MKRLFFFILTIIFIVNIQAQWSEQVSGVSSDLRYVNSVSSSVAWICGATGVVLKTTNTGTNWVNVSSGLPTTNTLINISAVDANTALVVGYSTPATYMYRTSNGGANWTQVLTETGFYDAVWMVNASTGFMAGDPVNNRWSFWKTTNGGVNWDSSGLYCPASSSTEGYNSSMYVVYPKIWVGTNDTSVLYSSNFGSSWVRYKTNGEVFVYSMCFDWSTGQTGLLGGSLTMQQTSNLGANWSSVTVLGAGNLNGITFTNLPITDFVSPAWYIRSSTNIYASYNGSTWTTEYTATAGNYRGISQAKPGRGIWAVRQNGGISYHTILADINKISTNIPAKYELSQNYPNPFNPVTTIKFQLPQSGFVTLKVYDALGKEIQTLIEQEVKPGVYETKFNSEGLSSGIYFYKLVTDKFSDVKRMVLVK